MAPSAKAFFNSKWYAINEIRKITTVKSEDSDCDTEMYEVVFKKDNTHQLVPKNLTMGAGKLVAQYWKRQGQAKKIENGNQIEISDDDEGKQDQQERESTGFVDKIRRSVELFFNKKTYDPAIDGETSKAAAERDRAKKQEMERQAQVEKPVEQPVLVTFDSTSVCNNIIHGGLKVVHLNMIGNEYSRAEFSSVLVLKDLAEIVYPELFERASALDPNDKVAKYKMKKQMEMKEERECDGPLHYAIRAVDVLQVEEDETLVRVIFKSVNVKKEDEQFFLRFKPE